VQEVFASREELLWPEKIVCGHSDHEAAAPPVASENLKFVRIDGAARQGSAAQ
jgi:hypothetical protein